MGEKNGVVFIFMPGSNCMERRCPGHVPTSNRCHCKRGGSTAFPLHLSSLFSVKPKTIRLNQTFVIFNTENTLEFEVWIQMPFRELLRDSKWCQPVEHDAEERAVGSGTTSYRDNTTKSGGPLSLPCGRKQAAFI